jgi:hypothetical protein
MFSKNQIKIALGVLLITLCAACVLATAMGQNPPKKNVQVVARLHSVNREKLASLAGLTRKKVNVLETDMQPWESGMYETYLKITQDVNPGTKVLFFHVDDKDVRVGLDSSFAIVVESNYYGEQWEGDKEGEWRGIHFVQGSLYAIDTMQRVLWRKEFACDQEPMFGQNLQIEQFGNRYFIIQIPDPVRDEYNQTCILYNNMGKEVKKFEANNSPKLSPFGKYLTLLKYDDRGYKDIIYNLYDDDSVVVYGATVDIHEYDDLLIISSNYDIRAPDKVFKYSQVKGQIIDLRP